MKVLVRFLLLGFVRLLVGAQARWEGCAPVPRPRIYFANHASHLDTLAIMAAMPGELLDEIHPVAALDYWGQTPFKRFIAEVCLGAILLDRSPRGRKDPPNILVRPWFFNALDFREWFYPRIDPQLKRF